MSYNAANHSLLNQRERTIALTIQAGFLPEELPTLPGWDVSALFVPAQDVGGDFYDLFWLSQQRRLGLVVADVCGKGVGAALFMALIRTLIRAFARQHYSLSWTDTLMEADRKDEGAPGRGKRRTPPSIGIGALKNAISLTNAYLLENHGSSGMFATLFFGILDPVGGALSYINGGHCPPLLVREGQRIERLEPTGPALGFLLDAEWSIGNLVMEPKDMLLAYTDGIIEARSVGGGFFGEEWLDRLVSEPECSPETLNRRIAAEVSAFSTGRDQADDITLLAIQRSAIQRSATQRSALLRTAGDL